MSRELRPRVSLTAVAIVVLGLLSVPGLVVACDAGSGASTSTRGDAAASDDAHSANTGDGGAMHPRSEA
jgi:hypothetical protein